MTDNNEFKGLGGWLILVGIGVLISPFVILAKLYSTYTPIFEDGSWEALTTVGSEAYTPYFDFLLIGEMAFNTVVVLASIWQIYLFFSKHYLFPRIYISLITATLIFVPFDAWIVTLVFPSVPVFDLETTKELVKTLIVALIWIPYMIVSKRVKATFVEGMPKTEQTNDDVQVATEVAG